MNRGPKNVAANMGNRGTYVKKKSLKYEFFCAVAASGNANTSWHQKGEEEMDEKVKIPLRVAMDTFVSCTVPAFP